MKPERISVVVPALDEAAELPRTLARVALQAEPVEVLVVDGGSGDGTAAVALAQAALLGLDLRVLDAPRGRARQMNAGAAAASGSVLVFLHADTRLPAGALKAARAALADPAVVGGCFRTSFDTSSPLLRLWTAGVWMRWHRLAFGDRAPFVRRRAFEQVGGFPEQPMFEDLELVQRLRRTGRFVFLDAAVVTSARRFRKHGAFRQQARNFGLWLGWLAGVSPRRLERFYTYDVDGRG